MYYKCRKPAVYIKRYSSAQSIVVEMHQATVRGFDIREAVFAWLDACNRKPKAELLPLNRWKTDLRLMRRKGELMSVMQL